MKLELEYLENRNCPSPVLIKTMNDGALQLWEYTGQMKPLLPGQNTNMTPPPVIPDYMFMTSQWIITGTEPDGTQDLLIDSWFQKVVLPPQPAVPHVDPFIPTNPKLVQDIVQTVIPAGDTTPVTQHLQLWEYVGVAIYYGDLPYNWGDVPYNALLINPGIDVYNPTNDPNWVAKAQYSKPISPVVGDEQQILIDTWFEYQG